MGISRGSTSILRQLYSASLEELSVPAAQTSTPKCRDNNPSQLSTTKLFMRSSQEPLEEDRRLALRSPFRVSSGTPGDTKHMQLFGINRSEIVYHDDTCTSNTSGIKYQCPLYGGDATHHGRLVPSLNEWDVTAHGGLSLVQERDRNIIYFEM
ncbi:hypothetical protein L218DRAFT_951712 [Marasmius fiardii PR-910]|nr:hypothetical protein L218DRAFT_951712 [Marasmius fiardii PR-910]